MLLPEKSAEGVFLGGGVLGADHGVPLSASNISSGGRNHNSEGAEVATSTLYIGSSITGVLNFAKLLM
ncbi:hypothetical protein HanXRQr2_Chr15g0705881 [Helianthus annuus]|uniref:Uncharacterized protein n=1 Tax=Helianthus annuus TaxID=4232 RepID=A0A9K3E3G8_HELAN|nr:hypothetical protein HanXRQr2_Chr15g0705881 [Helianthus annuus]KAJ0832326.1 hypothetical protein HanPSC8_Chr15g0677511 [Helianthus annuus]